MGLSDYLYGLPRDYQPLRGGERIDMDRAMQVARASSQDVVGLLGIPVPSPLLNRGVVFQGAQGTGKTLSIISLIAPAIARAADPTRRETVLLIDLKGDLTPVALSLAKLFPVPPPVYLLNPFDRFSVALNPHELTADPTEITRLVHAITYRKRDARTDDFFDTTARAHLIDLVKILKTRVPGRWTWRDLFLIGTSYELLERVLENSRIGRSKSQAIVQKTFAGIVSTIQSWLDQYEATFACYSQSAKFSINAFLRGRGIAILTAPEDKLDSLGPITRTLLRTVKDRLLTASDRDDRSQTTIVLDEFAYLDNCVEAVEPFFGRARSANVSVICAWQSWPAVCAAHGELRMKGLLDNAAVRVWFGCGAESAERAALDCMKAEVRQRDISVSHGHQASWSESFRTQMRVNVLASEIQSLPPPSRFDPNVRAFVMSSHLGGPVFAEHDVSRLWALLNAIPKVASIRTRPAKDFWLAPWDDVHDANRLEPLFLREN